MCVVGGGYERRLVLICFGGSGKGARQKKLSVAQSFCPNEEIKSVEA